MNTQVFEKNHNKRQLSIYEPQYDKAKSAVPKLRLTRVVPVVKENLRYMHP